MAEPTDLRTLAAEAAALAIGVENGPGGEDFLIADAVLAAVLLDLAERLTALATTRTTPLDQRLGLLQAASELRRLAATGPSAPHQTPQTPEQAEVVVPEAPEAQGPAEGVCCDLHGRDCEPPSELCCHDCTEAAHDTFPIRHADGSTCSAPDLSAPLLADLDRVTRQRDAAAENLEIMYRVRDETAVDLAKVTAERDRLAETIRQVRALHRPGDFPDCRACGDPWPCPTAAALGDAGTGQADDGADTGKPDSKAPRPFVACYLPVAGDWCALRIGHDGPCDRTRPPDDAGTETGKPEQADD